MIAAAFLIIAAASLAGWLYWLTYRQQRLMDRAEPILGALEQLLAALPGKSAPRSDAGPDAVPAIWWQRLGATAPPAAVDDRAPETLPGDRVLLQEWAAEVDHDQAPTDRIPVVGGRHRHPGSPR